MYSEIGFIFNPIQMSNKDNTGSIYGRSLKIKKKSKPLNDPNTSGVNPGEVTPLSGGLFNNPTGNPPVEATLVFKSNKQRVTIPNYLKETIYKDDNDGDPYISLLNHFGSIKSMVLRPADFAYLRDLGVYPTNRLWILRRYPDNCIVPNNLLEWGKNSIEPISTVVGWIKNKDESDFLSIKFHEVWTDQYDMLDKLFAEILKEEFGQDASKFIPVPGWSQGILFGILKQMGLTSDYDYNNIPTGDPNVLRQAKMRDIKSQGLLSSMSISLETTYEQKFINGIDPGMAMMDLISNLFKMGTSDQRFILGNSTALQMLLSGVYKEANIDTWLKLGKQLLESFIIGVQNFIKEVVQQPTSNAETASTEYKKPEAPSSATTTKTLSLGNIDTESIKAMGGVLRNIGDILLVGTISKYRWPLKGSIGLMSGMNTTPWHLTIGNPLSPIINIGNIVVNNVELKLSNDMGFNDMPVSVTAIIDVEMGRPLGKTELERMFNNGYSRLYSSDNNPAIVKPSQVTADEKTASDRNIDIMNNANQAYNNLITGGLNNKQNDAWKKMTDANNTYNKLARGGTSY